MKLLLLSTSSSSLMREELVGCWAPGRMVSKASKAAWIPSKLGTLV